MNLVDLNHAEIINMNHFKSIPDVNEYLNIETQHPFIDIRKYEDLLPLEPRGIDSIIFDFYKIAFVKNFNGYLQYGKTKFTGNSGVLYFLEPGQLYSCNSKNRWQGFQILIHPDIYKKYQSEKNINTCSFFLYDINESLLLTKNEEQSITYLMNEAWCEINQKKDEYSIPIVLSYISTLFNKAERYYSRQFSSRKMIHNQLVNDFFKELKNYYNDNNTSEFYDKKQPTVLYFANKLNITPNYLSDLVRRHSGKSALNNIHDYIIEEAKMLLTTSNRTVAEISYTLGFKYPNYFSRFFKKKTNLSPSDYRKSVKSI